MESEQESIRLDIGQWNLRIDERTRGRMKLQIKLGKDEAIAFKNFASICKPEGVSDDQFIKTLFITGVETMNKELTKLVHDYAEENKEELASSGITVIDTNEDGIIRLQDSNTVASGADFAEPGGDVTITKYVDPSKEK